MKTSTVVNSLRDILDLGSKKKKKAALKKILKKLKKKQIGLKKKLAATQGDKGKKALTAKLKVNHTHRKKGLKALRMLNGKE